MSASCPEPRERPSRLRGRGRLAVAAGAALTASLALAGEARADYVDNSLSGKPEKVCPLIFGSACKITISADLILAHQPTWSDDNGTETYFRSGVEAGFGALVAPDVHLGPSIEVGSQDGDFMSGFHVVPKLRARYWIASLPISLDLSVGAYFGRTWLDTSSAPRNRMGVQVDGGFGFLGSIHIVGGFAIVPDAGGLYGNQTQAFVGARLSFLSLLFAAAFSLKR